MISRFYDLCCRAKRRRDLLAVSLLGIFLLLGSIPLLPGKLPVQAVARLPEQPLAREEAAPPRLDHLGDPLPLRAVERFGTCRLRHAKEVGHLAFSPNSKLLASVGRDRTIHLWDTRTGAPVTTRFPVANQPVLFAPDGKSLVLHSIKELIVSHIHIAISELAVWDVATGRVRFTIEDRKLDVRPISFSPDGSLLLTKGPDGRISFWDARTGALRRKSTQRYQSVFSITFLDKDEALVLSVTPDNNKWILSYLFTGKEFRTFPLDPRKDLSQQKYGFWPLVSISADGRWVASCPQEGPAYVWNVRTRKERCRLPMPSKNGSLDSVALSADGKYLAIHALYGIRLWELDSSRLLLNVPHAGRGMVRFSPDGRMLAACSDRRVRLFDVATAKELTTPPGHTRPVEFVAFSPSGEYLASASRGGIRLWKVQSSEQQQNFPQEGFYHESEIRAQFSPDGRQVIIHDSPKSVSFWDVQSGNRLRRMTFPKEVTGFVLSPDGKNFLVEHHRTTNPHGLQLCATASGEVVHTFPTTRNFGLMAFLPNGKEVVVYETTRPWDSLGKLVVWDTATGEHRRSIPDQLEGWQEVHSLAISPAGRYLATGSGRARVIAGSYSPGPKSNPIQLWDLVSGKLLLRLERHLWPVKTLAWSPDGRILASADKGGHICLWEVASGKELTCYETLFNGVHGLAFSPQGNVLASAMDDTTVLLWDIATADWKVPPKGLTARERNRRWADLASEDAATAQRAIWDLAASPADTVAFLVERLHPVPTESPERLDQLVADLDSDTFARREAATKELARLGTVAESALRKPLENSPSVELRRRAESLLKALPDWVINNPETLRIVRAIWVLQRIGTPEARAVLEKLAAGAPTVRQTQEAKAALQFLDRMKKR